MVILTLPRTVRTDLDIGGPAPASSRLYLERKLKNFLSLTKLSSKLKCKSWSNKSLMISCWEYVIQDVLEWRFISNFYQGNLHPRSPTDDICWTDKEKFSPTDTLIPTRRRLLSGCCCLYWPTRSEVQIISACLNRFPPGTYFQARSLSRSDRWTPLSTSCLTWPSSQWENFHRQLAPILNELNDTLLSQRRQLIFTDKSKIQIWLLCVIWEPRIYMDFTPDKTRTGLLFFQQI